MSTHIVNLKKWLEGVRAPTPENFPPGPRGLALLKLYRDFQKNPLEGYTSLRRQFGFTAGIYGARSVVFAFHPKDIEYVLKTNHKNYTKSDSYKELHPLLGQGLVTSEGELWRRQRLLVAKEFHPESIKNFLPVMQKYTEQMLEAWAVKAEQAEYFDLYEHMMSLTFQIAGTTLFGEDLGENADMVRDALADMTELAIKRILRPLRLPYTFPLPSHVRALKKLKKLDEMVYALIESYAQKNEGQGTNVLVKLMSAPNMPRTLLRDEIMTLLMAGHETTSNALSWTFYLLATDPQIQRKAQREVREVIGQGEHFSYENLQKLSYLKALLMESMRLYPPVPVVSRNTLSDDEIGGNHVPAHTIVATIPFVTHRDAAFFPEPEKFLPERFLAENISKHTPYAYFPFAAGPRRCIGEDFAVIESLLVLAKVLQKFSLTLKPGFTPELAGHITLRSLNGMWMGVEKTSVS